MKKLLASCLALVLCAGFSLTAVAAEPETQTYTEEQLEEMLDALLEDEKLEALLDSLESISSLGYWDQAYAFPQIEGFIRYDDWGLTMYANYNDPGNEVYIMVAEGGMSRPDMTRYIKLCEEMSNKDFRQLNQLINIALNDFDEDLSGEVRVEFVTKNGVKLLHLYIEARDSYYKEGYAGEMYLVPSQADQRMVVIMGMRTDTDDRGELDRAMDRLIEFVLA